MDIDLNQSPINHELHNEEDIPILVTSSSSESIVISLNSDNNGIQNLIIELDLNQLNEDNGEIWSDSSEEVDKQTIDDNDDQQIEDNTNNQQGTLTFIFSLSFPLNCYRRYSVYLTKTIYSILKC